MKITKYKKITTQRQYDKYCKELVSYVFGEEIKEFKEEIKLLNSLIEEWEKEHIDFSVTA